MIERETRSAEETAQDAAALAKRVHGGLHIALHGELGAGKTTWARGFLRGLGFSGTVRSPTYTLVEPYAFAEFTVYHFDLYRLSQARELEQLGYRDYFNESGVCLVEWPERAGGLLGTPDLRIEFSARGTSRRISCVPGTEAGRLLLAG